MVFSEELGYDPEEWEECPDPDHWLAFSFPTRVLMSILTIIVSVLFFWVIEKRKSWDKPIKAEEEKSSVKRENEASDRQSRRDAEERRNPLEESWPQIIEENRSRTASATPRRRRSSKKAMTPEEQSALLDWERQLNEVAERRLRETQEEVSTRAQSSHPYLESGRGVDRLPLTDEVELNSTFGLPQNAFDNQSMLSDFTGGTSAILRDIQRLRVSECATPPSTPPGGAPSFEAHYRQTADDLQKKLTAEIKHNATQTPHSSLADIQKQLTEQLQQRYEEDIRQAVDRLQREHADEVDEDIGEQLRHQLESQIQGVVRERWPSQGQSPEFTIGDDRDDTLKKRDVVKGGDKKDETIEISGQSAPPNKPSEEFEQDGSPKGTVRGSINGKGSSSSDDGFVKVEREDEGPDELQQQNLPGSFLTPIMATGMHREQSEPEMLTAPSPTMEEWSDSGGGISPGQRVSIDIDDTVTADDIEFVLRSGGQPQVQVEQQSPVSSNSPPEEVLDLDIGEEEGLGQYDPQQSVTIPDSLDAHRNELLLKRADDLSLTKARDNVDKRVTGEEIDYPFDEALNQQESRTSEGEKKLTPEEKRALDAREEEQMLNLLQEYDMAAAGGMLGQPSPASQHAPSVSSVESPTGFHIVEIAPVSPDIPSTPPPRKMHKRGSDPHSTLSDEKSRYEQLEEPIPGQISIVVPTRAPNDSKVHQLNAGVSDVQEVPMTQDRPGALQSHLVRQGPVIESDERWSEERRNIDEIDRRERVFISEKPLDDDPRRLAQAETYLKDAMDFMENREPPRRSGSSSTGVCAGGFVMEEEMLESDKGQPPAAPKIGDQGPGWRSSDEKARIDVPGLVSDTQQQNASADPTSRLVKTNEVFGKAERAVTAGGEPSFDEEADDAITYAPEIQSVEIPPDQISESSLNLVENLESEHHDYKPPQAGTQKADDQKSKETAAKVDSITKQEKLAESNLLESTNGRAGKVTEESNLRREPSPRRPSPTRRPSAPQFHILRKNDKNGFDDISTSSMSSTSKSMHKQSSLLSALGVTSTQEMLLKLPSLDALSDAMRKAGLESTNLIFGIDYTASNKYQGERSFKGRSLHSVADSRTENPYQQVIKIMGRTLAPFATSSGIPVYGFGDSTTGDWSVFPLNGTKVEECRDLEEVLRVYNAVTPNVDLSGPTNFAPLIHKAVKLCQKNQDYHILVIIADGQVTNERATRKAIVQACQYPLSIIVVGVGDGPWDMMRVFDESLPKRPWDNFHFVEFHEIINERNDSEEASELNFAIHSLLEVPDQYQLIQKMGLLPNLKHTPATSKASTANTTPLPEREDNIEDFV
ncbi:copine domain-containing protein [Ditylenchus destructor]|uniref:Copine domain-containing protein n=1 Tax=Ditylenchus destructor TaxID=166010 RepID=A0AAD4N119_9BILA|nr:copine domain-containing protein [Ditylenchus destructor]